MEDLFKKFINAGVGFVSLTNDRVQSTIDKLVKESKLSEQEGAKIMDDLKKNTDTKRKEMEKQLQTLSSRLMKSVGVAPNAEVEELKRTVKGGAKSASSAAATTATKSNSKPAAKTATAAKGVATSTAGKAAAPVKKAAAKTGATASKAQKSAAGSAGAAKKEDNQAAGAASSQNNS